MCVSTVAIDTGSCSTFHMPPAFMVGLNKASHMWGHCVYTAVCVLPYSRYVHCVVASNHLPNLS